MEEKKQEDINVKIQDLQLLEQSLQSLLMQKQSFQLESLDVENAIEELKNADQEVYKIIGPAMLKMSKPDLDKDLKNKKALLDMRIKSIEKQEHDTRDKLLELRQEIMTSFERDKKNTAKKI